MTDEWEIVNFKQMYEQQMVRDHMQNPNPEYARELLELAAAHKTNSLDYPMTDELKNYLIDCVQEFASGTKAERAFKVAEKMGRPSSEYRDISMCCEVWSLVLKGEAATYAFEATADKFSEDDKEITYETVKRVWERKNHQFGEREICRRALDMFLVLEERTLTPEEEKIANKYLREEVSIAAMKNYKHIRAKYKDKFKFKNVKKKVLNMNADDSNDRIEDA